MKFGKKETIIIYFAIATIMLCFNEASAFKTNTKSKVRNSESMMEYLNSFFSEGAEQNEAILASAKKFKFSEVEDRGEYRAFMADNSTDSNSSDSNSSDSNSTDEVLQDWFEISSPSFKNVNKFPPVRLLNGKVIKIPTDSNFFRMNSAFDELKDEDKPIGKKYFWFRLSGLQLYYSNSKHDLSILGAVSIKLISLVIETSDPTQGPVLYCIGVEDNEDSKWKICNPSQKTTHKWLCQIKKYLKLEDVTCPKEGDGDDENSDKDKPNVIEKQVTQPIIIIPLPSKQCNEDWNYQENGTNWECECTGKEQSPIDLPSTSKSTASPVKPLFQYEEIGSSSEEEKEEAEKKKKLKIAVEDNMLKIKHDYMGKLVTVDGSVYFAQEIQIHTPAEHTIEGKTFAMEIQILHTGQSKGDLAKQAILSFLIEKKPGVYNKFIDDLDFFNLPNPMSRERNIVSSLSIPKIFYSADEEHTSEMKNFSFYTYQGSLTSPPCLESTVVYVASKPIQLGSSAIKLFQEAIRTPDAIGPTGDINVNTQIPMSNRKPQPRNGRPVFHYDHVKYCGPDEVKVLEKKVEGHYEKIVKPLNQYFYVNGEEPSGMTGALVVPEEEATGKVAKAPLASIK